MNSNRIVYQFNMLGFVFMVTHGSPIGYWFVMISLYPWLPMIIRLYTNLLCYGLLSYVVELFLRLFENRSITYCRTLIGTIDWERRITCKYNSTYSISKCFTALHVFQSSCINVCDTYVLCSMLWHHESMVTNDKSHSKNKINFQVRNCF